MKYSKQCLESAIKHQLPDREDSEHVPELLQEVACKMFLEDVCTWEQFYSVEVCRTAFRELKEQGHIEYGEEDISIQWQQPN